jgi:YegS/Rv2252/BmrU family lipid kinase
LAAEAVREGFDTIVAAGGDGTLNEVLNGIGDEAEGFHRVRLGLLPLGTVNVFARELGLPLRWRRAWEVLRAGRERRLDLACVRFQSAGRPQQRYFVQMAGAGLDARATELVDGVWKKRTGVAAYLGAGLKALREPQPPIHVTGPGWTATGELVLIGNGRRYAGPFRMFPSADPADGLLDVRVFPRADGWTAAACLWGILTGRLGRVGRSHDLRAAAFTLASVGRVPFELDGETAGELPASFGVISQALRVVGP